MYSRYVLIYLQLKVNCWNFRKFMVYYGLLLWSNIFWISVESFLFCLYKLKERIRNFHKKWLFVKCKIVFNILENDSIPCFFSVWGFVLGTCWINGSPTIRDRDVSGVGISDRSGLRYRHFGTLVPTVREFRIDSSGVWFF